MAPGASPAYPLLLSFLLLLVAGAGSSTPNLTAQLLYEFGVLLLHLLGKLLASAAGRESERETQAEGHQADMGKQVAGSHCFSWRAMKKTGGPRSSEHKGRDGELTTPTQHIRLTHA